MRSRFGNSSNPAHPFPLIFEFNRCAENACTFVILLFKIEFKRFAGSYFVAGMVKLASATSRAVFRTRVNPCYLMQ
jgi:hypothetical protein